MEKTKVYVILVTCGSMNYPMKKIVGMVHSLEDAEYTVHYKNTHKVLDNTYMYSYPQYSYDCVSTIDAIPKDTKEYKKFIEERISNIEATLNSEANKKSADLMKYIEREKELQEELKHYKSLI